MAGANGMLVFYYDADDGEKVNVEGDIVNDGTLWNWDSIGVDTKSKKLKIKRSKLFNNNNAMEYSLDGWTGRYGMPLEFLLSIHKATLMPDLAVDMATSFKTEVKIYLHSIGGEAKAAYKVPDGYIPPDGVEYEIEGFVLSEDIEKAKNNGNTKKSLWGAIRNWFDDKFETEDETVAMMNLGIDVVHNCPDCKKTTIYYTDENGNNEFDDDEELLLAVDENDDDIYDVNDKYYYCEKNDDGSYTKDEYGNKIIDTSTGKEAEDSTEDDPKYTGEYEGIVGADTTAVKEVCGNCKKKSKEITKVVVKNQDYHYLAYQPYIANVTGHWYRDVYFIKSGSKEFVDYDYDYEALTKERWTLYETYTNNPSDGYKYNPDKEGEFILVELDEDGNEKWSNGDPVLFEGTIEDARPSTLYEKDASGNYKEYKGSMNGAESKGLYQKLSSGDYMKFTGNVAVAKKAVTISSSDTSVLEDLGWQETNGKWSAYEENDDESETGFQPLFPENAEDLKGDDASISDEVKARSYINVKTKGNVLQVGEGQRTETNAEIKKMFLINKYFRYDGSHETAEIITALRNKVTDDRSDKIKYGPLSDSELEKTYTIDGKEYKVGDYAGNVLLQQDALNAFSMLENTHTLDADYIYRDFKELVVELGYFEKEELTESIPRILQFLVPDIGSGGYPNRTIDKKENAFGTMVHSKYDIDTNDKYTLQSLVAQAIQDAVSGEMSSEGQTGNTLVSGASNNLSDTVSAIRAEAQDPNKYISLGSVSSGSSSSLLSLDEWWAETQKMFDIFQSESWTYGHTNGNTTFETAKDKTTDCSICASWMLQKLGALQGSNTFTSHMGVDNGVVDFNESHAAAKDLLDAGAEVIVPPSDKMIKQAVDDGELEPGDLLFYEGHVAIYCGTSYEKGGEYFCWDTGSTNGIQCGGPRDCNWSVTDGGKPIKLIVRLPLGSGGRGNPYKGFIGNEAVVSPVTGVLLEYGTYEIEEPVNVTVNADDEESLEDKVQEAPERVNLDLLYGTSVNKTSSTSEGEADENATSGGTNTNTNTDEADVQSDTRLVSEEVGYARILVLDKENYEILESMVSNQWTSNNGGQGLLSDKGVYQDVVTTEQDLENLGNDATNGLKNKTIYGYKEFAEKYEAAGIAGNEILITGFKCELPDENFTDSNQNGELHDENGNPNGKELKLDSFKIKPANLNDTNELIQTKYEAEPKYKLASKKASEKLNVESTLLTEAAPAISVNDLVFIKEGTVIGRTYTNKEIVEEVRNEKLEDYIAKISPASGAEEDKIIGNYLHIIMTHEGEVVENIEEYMKIDEGNSGGGVFGDLEAIDENSTDAEKIRAAATYFVSMGFSEQAACGIIGNLIQESGLDPKAKNPAGYYGLVQWNGNIDGRWDKVKNWMASQGYNEDSFAGQIRSIYECPDELNQMDQSRWEELKGLTNIEQAAELFCVYNERCVGGSDSPVWYSTGFSYQELNQRKRFAKNAYDIYMGDDSKGIRD